MQSPHQREVLPSANSEAGYMLIAVVVMTALVLIALSVAAPMVAKDIRRDKEVESEMRARQYVRAIRLYQRKFPGQYPASIDALEKTNNIRFLRQQYVDPLTGKADWRIIHLGQQQTTIKIPFGQELAGLGATGIGGGAAPVGGFGASPSGPSTINSASPLAGGFLGSTVGSNGSSGSTGSTGGVKSTDATAFGGGGGPIVGVGTSRTGDSILNPNEQTTYDTWEFWYDPRIELLYKGSNILGGGGLGGGTGSGGINSINSSSFGTDINGKSNKPTNSSGSGTNGSTPQQ
ncbi:MAG TPA: type II secretion system protein [Acidobacteriaceae bacterium]|jgi:type II secretory pathway pseudopilin PulG